MIVADHEAPAVGKHPAEALLPPEHRSPDPHDQEDRRVRPLAEGLGAEPDAVGLDDALSHAYPPRTRRIAIRYRSLLSWVCFPFVSDLAIPACATSRPLRALAATYVRTRSAGVTASWAANSAMPVA